VAAGDLTTLEHVKTYLRVEDVVDDAWLTQLIGSSSAWVKSETGRDILAADYTHTFRGDHEDGVTLPQYPVQSVTSVTVDGVALTKDVDWEVDGRRVELLTGRFTRGAKVVIVYRAGYGTVPNAAVPAIPSDLEQAVILRVALTYYDRDRLGKGSVSLQGESVSFNGGVVKSEIDGTLDKYRRVSV
jgi:uncharacterized phiE125 gp8 family phage protein